MATPLLEQLKSHKTELLVGGAAVAATIALYARSKKTTTQTTAAVATPVTTVAPTGYEEFPGTTVATTEGTDAYNGLENQILGLQQALLGLSGQSAAKTQAAAQTSGQAATSHVSTDPYTQEAFAGEGYYIEGSGGRSAGNVEGMTGAIFSTISSYTATLQELEAGDTVYYESSLGGFTPITSVTQFESLEPTGKGGAHDTTTWSKVA